MWLRDDHARKQQSAGEHRWTWIWLGRDATDTDINDLVRQVHAEVAGLPTPLGIGDFMLTVTVWGPRHDGTDESYYLWAKQEEDDIALQNDLAQRDRPRVIQVGDVARGHLIDRDAWSASARAQLRHTLQIYRPSKQWRIVHVSLFSVGEAYLKMVARPALTS